MIVRRVDTLLFVNPVILFAGITVIDKCAR